MNEWANDVTLPTWDESGTTDYVDANQNLYPYLQPYDVEPIEPLLFEDSIPSNPSTPLSDEQQEQRRIKRNAQARKRYQKLSKSQRQDYMKRGNLYTYGVDPSDPNLTSDDHLHIVRTKAVQLENRRTRYHELPDEEKKEKIRKGNEQRGKRRLKEYLIMSTPVEDITEEVLEQTLDITERKNREVEKYSMWYQRQSEEKKQEIRDRDRETKRLKRENQSLMKGARQENIDDETVPTLEVEDFSYTDPQDLAQYEPPAEELEHIFSVTTPNEPTINEVKKEQIKMQRVERRREMERARYHRLTEEQRREKNRKNIECRRRNAEKRRLGSAYQDTSSNNSTSEDRNSEPTNEQLLEEQEKKEMRRVRKNEMRRARHRRFTEEEKLEYNRKRTEWRRRDREKKKLASDREFMDMYMIGDEIGSSSADYIS